MFSAEELYKKLIDIYEFNDSITLTCKNKSVTFSKPEFDFIFKSTIEFGLGRLSKQIDMS